MKYQYRTVIVNQPPKGGASLEAGIHQATLELDDGDFEVIWIFPLPDAESKLTRIAVIGRKRATY